ncbi:galactosylceramide sulfotransferase-like isoform X2 [Clavelina lepadiformis]|uniref:galactosylceramide sulfotransferase-like isoform X2 n=1 Tax=Clavelina lepadiformis TaxID=159417 RepID=UPI0040433C88
MKRILKLRSINGRTAKIQVLAASIFVLCAVNFYRNRSLSKTEVHMKIKNLRNIKQSNFSPFPKNSSYDDKQADECFTWRPFVFLKTHKTGSTTVVRMMHHYIKKNALTKVHAYVHPYVGGFPGRLQQRFLMPENWNELDRKNGCKKTVISDHFRLDLTAIKDFMPERTRYFTIIRQPWKQFQSSFNYFYAKNTPRKSLTGTMKKLLKANCFVYPYLHIAEGRNIDVLEYFDLAFENLDQNIPYFFRSKNPQAFALGLDPYLEGEEEMKKNIAILDSGMDLVMISEHMDESLILLKNMMNMTWENLLGEDKNVRNYPHYNMNDYPERYAKFQKMFKLDILLYRHFNATLWRKVDEYGRERMDNDITKLRKLRGVTKAKILQTESNRMKKSNFDFKDLFDSIPKTYNVTYLVDILYGKLSNLEERDKKLSYDLARYMVDNHGGCPL